MSKQHTTIKNIRNNWAKVFRAGYCDLSYIFHHEEPQYYNAGVYGWNCDIYCDYSRDIAITTGYRNMAGIRIPDEILKKYDAIAKKIIENQWGESYEATKAKLDENRNNFFAELENI
jgi:hypothetical protein